MKSSISQILVIGHLLSGVSALAQEDKSPVVASVNERKITLAEFEKRYKEVKQNTLNPPGAQTFLEDLVRYEMGVLEAEKRDMRKDPVVVDRINQELYKGLVERAIGEKVGAIKISDADMREFYKKNPEMRSSHILTEFRPGAKPEEIDAARKRALEIYEEVKKSKRPFEELVKLYSDDVLSKRNGGDVGWQTRMTVMPAYYESLQSMKLNEIKGLVESPYGFHIVKLTGRRSYEQANKQQIRAAVFEMKRKIIFDQYFVNLKKSYAIKVNASLLK